MAFLAPWRLFVMYGTSTICFHRILRPKTSLTWVLESEHAANPPPPRALERGNPFCCGGSEIPSSLGTCNQWNPTRQIANMCTNVYTDRYIYIYLRILVNSPYIIYLYASESSEMYLPSTSNNSRFNLSLWSTGATIPSKPWFMKI